uniref:BED-type domain-containing protein n=1 Tax=Ditylenchus dipsaci TaxID=166011 RepID=A0A915EPY8_9BILA
MSLKEAKCNVCQANIKLSNAGPTNLKVHLAKHPAYQKQFGVMENAEESEKRSMKQGLEKFVVRRTNNNCQFNDTMPFHLLLGELSALDRMILHLVACQNLPFSIVEAKTFKQILSSGYRENMRGSQHYREWVMPRVYMAVRKEVLSRLNDCNALSGLEIKNSLGMVL